VTSAAPAFTTYCPSCSTGFPIDPAKVPVEGVHAICSACLRVFRVLLPAENREPWEGSPGAEPSPAALAGEDAKASAGTALAEAGAREASALASEKLTRESVSTAREAGLGEEPSVAAGAERFGHRDPRERARHLARVLVSDIIAYYPVKYRESVDRGTLQEDFRSEVDRSWKEYVDQVGLEMAEGTPFFRDALNQVLGKGKIIF
jgi:predicted Zn finger-like uncharacterized protein